LTPADEFDATNLMRIITGSIGSYNTSAISLNFSNFFSDKSTYVENVVSLLNYDIHPDLANGIRIYINAYTSTDGLVTEASFLQLHHDMFASNSESFGVVIDNIWNW